MNDFQTLHEIVKAARANTPDGAWDYLTGGAETETTQLRNRLALDSLGFRPRVLRNVREIDTSTTLLGEKMRMPVFIAPMGSLQMLDPSAGLGVAKAAESFGITSILSSVVPPGLEVVGDETRHPKVYQLYVRGERDWVDDHVKRAIKHGYSAFCFTLDTAIYGRRERDTIKRHVPAARRGASGFEYQADMTWELIAWFKKHYPQLPLVLKGIANAEDAMLAVEHGAEVVYISNHGGRQLDHGVGTIAVLQEVLQAVDGRAEVVIDGGFLRGTDVVKAIALGAKAVGIARLVGFGLAAGGEAGVARMLELLETEIRMAMGLLGVTRVGDLKPSYVREAPPVRAPHALYSAFPFLALPEQRY
jgi:isopentenyl diphosphate isomerase/L-lactate dehydrogenase-like FMN-dependent dehydrogenase